jgi:hypothetical protein
MHGEVEAVRFVTTAAQEPEALDAGDGLSVQRHIEDADRIRLSSPSPPAILNAPPSKKRSLPPPPMVRSVTPGRAR